MNDFRKRCTTIAERFLQTAVIVDDQARIDDSFRHPVRLKTPDRRTLTRSPEETAQAETDARHSLDARLLVDSFSEHGLICAVIAPRPDTAPAATVARAALRADIVILDWQLNGDNGKRALLILSEILAADAGGRLRLIAVYTGEQDISGIGCTIARELKAKGRKFELCDRDVVLRHGHCRIVIYAKSNTKLTPDLEDRSISEIDVPKCLISDFADMTMGLLPSVVLTSLAAVRENTHKILDRFHTRLDAAFLTHRACLPAPDESQQHIVSQIAGELHAIMDDATASTSPAGIDAIREWLSASAGSEADFIFEGNKKLSIKEAVDLLDQGLEQKSGPLGNKGYKILTAGFARTENPGNELDLQLAWMMNFRTVFNASPPILHLGTVLWKRSEINDSAFFLCMRPRCDSARLQGEEPFLLLPLAVPPREKTIQLVIQTDASKYQCVSVCIKPSEWSLVRFAPNNTGGPVVAKKNEKGGFFFIDVDNTQFEWLGELKAEFAQRIVHRFASGLSRVAVDNSEWLRRSEKLSD